MRRALSLLLGLFLALPVHAALSRVAAPSALRATMAAALPGLSGVDPSAPAPVLLPAVAALVPAAPTPTPTLLDARKSAALFSRLPAAPAQPLAASPLQVLEAANATLKDFSPERLRGLSDGDIAALAGIVLDGAVGRAPRADLAGAGVLMRERWEKIRRLSEKQVEEVVINPGRNETHSAMIEAHGVPATAKPFRSEGTTFRYYVSERRYGPIMDGEGLPNGVLPYVEAARGVFKKVYVDLTGVFLTLPSVDGGRVGVPREEAAGAFNRYVDLRLSRGMPVLEIEKGLIYLIPLPARTRDWISERYRAWALGGGGSTETETAMNLERDGGLGPRLAVPIKIVRSGRVRP